MQKNLVGRVPPLSSAQAVRTYQYNGQKYSSTDSGDVSWVTPVATLNTATWVPGTPAHSWQATATGGMGIGIKAAVVAAKTLALTAAQLYQSPETIAAAKAGAAGYIAKRPITQVDENAIGQFVLRRLEVLHRVIDV